MLTIWMHHVYTRDRRQIAQLMHCETITEEEVKRLCIKAREILIEEGNVQVVDSPVTVRKCYIRNHRRD